MLGRTPYGSVEVLTFTHTDLHQRTHLLRLVIIDDEPWFLATDVCHAARCPLLVAVFNSDDVDHIQVDRRYLGTGKSILTDNHQDQIWLISEGRFYETILWERNDGQLAFKRWVTHEVLPTVRQLQLTSIPRANLPVIRKKITINETATKSRSVKNNPRSRSPHALYRFYDIEERLLYVGITWNIASRMPQHRSTQPWWYDVTNVTITPYPSRRAVLLAEQAAIRAEHPIYNTQHNAA